LTESSLVHNLSALGNENDTVKLPVFVIERHQFVYSLGFGLCEAVGFSGRETYYSER